MGRVDFGSIQERAEPLPPLPFPVTRREESVGDPGMTFGDGAGLVEQKSVDFRQ